MTKTHGKIIKKVVIRSMMTEMHEKIMKKVIISSLMTKTHKKFIKTGHHNIDDDRNAQNNHEKWSSYH
ncbi:hypothetical protein [Neobacillus niacini]|uniref:hypothetical protein n=1 Tax=Neobacillus niacini TaxID=86668 RepID=UPI002FFD5E1F